MSLNPVCSGGVLGRRRLAAPRLFALLDALLGRGTAMSKAVRLVAGLDDVTVVSEPVEQRGGHLGVGKYAGPFAEDQVSGDHHAGVLIEFAEQVEQQGTAGVAEGKVPRRRTALYDRWTHVDVPSPLHRRQGARLRLT